MDLQQIDWDSQLKLNDNNINTSFDKLYNQTNICLDEHAPLRKLDNTEVKQKFKL